MELEKCSTRIRKRYFDSSRKYPNPFPSEWSSVLLEYEVHDWSYGLKKHDVEALRKSLKMTSGELTCCVWPLKDMVPRVPEQGREALKRKWSCGDEGLWGAWQADLSMDMLHKIGNLPAFSSEYLLFSRDATFAVYVSDLEYVVLGATEGFMRVFLENVGGLESLRASVEEQYRLDKHIPNLDHDSRTYLMSEGFRLAWGNS